MQQLLHKKSMNSYDIIIELIQEMFRYKYQGIIFYAQGSTHNLGRYDIYFILKTLIDYNQVNNDNSYTFDFMFRDNVILKIRIDIEINHTKVYRKI